LQLLFERICHKHTQKKKMAAATVVNAQASVGSANLPLATGNATHAPVDVTADDVLTAAARIRPYVRRTPVMRSTSLETLGGYEALYFKVEAFQRSGSFKIRGATNAVCAFLESRPRNENNSAKFQLVTASSGNHGQGLARAAQFFPALCECHVVCPSTAPEIKVKGMTAFGAQMRRCDNSLAAREAATQSLLEALRAAHGAANVELIHPYDDPRVIAGQGTMALELLEDAAADHPRQQRLHFGSGGCAGAASQQQPVWTATSSLALLAAPSTSSPPLRNAGVPPPPPAAVRPMYLGALDAVIVPVGGGGMSSGVALAIKALSPTTLVIGAEPLLSADAAQSLRTGVRAAPLSTSTQSMADGLLTSLSPRTHTILSQHMDGIITVTEAEIARAMRLIYERLKVAVEPSAAVGVAAALFHRHTSPLLKHARRVGVILCGGNLDVDRIPEFLAKL
jgi:threonine dehydratase